MSSLQEMISAYLRHQNENLQGSIEEKQRNIDANNALLESLNPNQAQQPNIIEPDVEEPAPLVPNIVEPFFRHAEEGSFLGNINALHRSGFTKSIQISREQKLNLLELKRMNSRTFMRAVHRLGFAPNEKNNLLASIYRLENPERARANSRRSYMRRIGITAY